MKPNEVPAAKTAIMAFLNQLGIKTVLIEYSGGGDSGQVDEITALNIELEEDEWEIGQAEQEAIIDITKLTDDQVSVALVTAKMLDIETTTDLKDLLEQFCYAALDYVNASDWCNNDGGNGTVRIDVMRDAVMFNHSYNVTESCHEELESL